MKVTSTFDDNGTVVVRLPRGGTDSIRARAALMKALPWALIVQHGDVSRQLVIVCRPDAVVDEDAAGREIARIVSEAMRATAGTRRRRGPGIRFTQISQGVTEVDLSAPGWPAAEAVQLFDGDGKPAWLTSVQVEGPHILRVNHEPEHPMVSIRSVVSTRLSLHFSGLSSANGSDDAEHGAKSSIGHPGASEVDHTPEGSTGISTPEVKDQATSGLLDQIVAAVSRALEGLPEGYEFRVTLAVRKRP